MDLEGQAESVAATMTVRMVARVAARWARWARWAT